MNFRCSHPRKLAKHWYHFKNPENPGIQPIYKFIQMANSIQALLQQLESTSGKKEWLIRTKAVKKGPFDKYE